MWEKKRKGEDEMNDLKQEISDLQLRIVAVNEQMKNSEDHLILTE